MTVQILSNLARLLEDSSEPKVEADETACPNYLQVPRAPFRPRRVFSVAVFRSFKNLLLWRLNPPRQVVGRSIGIDAIGEDEQFGLCSTGPGHLEWGLWFAASWTCRA
jgi:hypothetical protein